MLKDAIKAEAKALGFSLIGFTTLEPPEHFPIYESWIRAGHHAAMQYLAREDAVERRGNPQMILPEAESLIVLGIRYPAPPANLARPSGDLTGRIASYALAQRDYHLILPPLLEKLVAFIRQRLTHEVLYRVYTDTGPILERELAQRAGLGWIGKNTCLISPEQGSYLFLCEILINHSFEPDPPFTADRCGTCRRCIEACPTDCILPNRTIDANRCISYQTIENKAKIPRELRPLMGDWVFGCDICQQVCPWNAKTADFPHSPVFDTPNIDSAPKLQETLNLTPREFNLAYKDTPIKRTKRRGFLRNITINLGNSKKERAVPALAKTLLEEFEPLVRAHAAWALGQFNTPAAKSALEAAKKAEKDPEVREEILRALTGNKRA